MKIIKTPTGIIYSELLHFMGGDDEAHYNERPASAKSLIDKMQSGKKIELTDDEHIQLIKECYNAIDIKKDHVYVGEEWNPLTQYHLVRFYEKLLTL